MATLTEEQIEEHLQLMRTMFNMDDSRLAEVEAQLRAATPAGTDTPPEPQP